MTENTRSNILEEGKKAIQLLFEAALENKMITKNKFGYYISPEAWQLLAAFWGMTARIVETNYMTIDGVKGWVAKAEVVDQEGVIRGAAEGVCFADEKELKNVTFNQMAQIAQTRATVKAISQLFSWVISMAGWTNNNEEEKATETKKEVSYDQKATRSQINYIFGLLNKLGLDPEVYKEKVKQKLNLNSFNDLKKNQASQLIEYLETKTKNIN